LGRGVPPADIRKGKGGVKKDLLMRTTKPRDAKENGAGRARAAACLSFGG
jgi:hypothetical protein